MDVGRRMDAGVLPALVHGFVGRDGELEKISTLLSGPARLITLVGPGGIGKTRLAAEVMRRFVKADTRTRVYWVRLARLAAGSDTTAVEEEIAHAVIETDFSGRSAWRALIDTFTRTDTTGRTPRTILVLDNCEHVLTGVGPLIAELLEVIPELTIVATSREPIGWIDEHLVTVPPLSDGQALTLFRHRAELIGHTLTGPEHTRSATQICRHVHNHPLYIQLAAARLRHQPAAMILAELTGQADDTRLGWSRGPQFGAESRHRGVTDVIDWSYRLCSDSERLLFDRLSVFAAGYAANLDDLEGSDVVDVGADLDAIQTVCADDQNHATGGGGSGVTGNESHGVFLARHEIKGQLNRLVDRSLVSVHTTSTSVRYSLVESLRVFAQQRLRDRSTPESDEAARLADRHLRYYHDKITYIAANWFDSEGQNLLEWARAAWANTIIAIETGLATGGADIALKICLGLSALQGVGIGGAVTELRRWTQRCLEATRASTPQANELQITAMATIALLASVQGCHEDAEEMLEKCVAACLPDPEIRRNWWHTAETDVGLPAPVEFALASELLQAHRDPRAITVFARARQKFDALGNYVAASRSEAGAAVAAGLLGTAQQAREITRGYCDRARISGSPPEKSWAEFARSTALTKHGDPAEALALERASLRYQLAVGDQWTGWMVVEFRMWSLARLLTDLLAAGTCNRTRLVALATEIAHLAGGTKTLRARLGITIEAMGSFAYESDNAVAVARRVLGPGYDAAEAPGSQLRPEYNEVQRLALGTFTIDTSSNTTTRMAITQRWHELTSAERQVAVLAAAEWTNASIAARRGKSVRTIDAQIAAILHKLAITTREDIIEYIPRDTIDQVRTETLNRPTRTNRKPSLRSQPR